MKSCGTSHRPGMLPRRTRFIDSFFSWTESIRFETKFDCGRNFQAGMLFSMTMAIDGRLLSYSSLLLAWASSSIRYTLAKVVSHSCGLVASSFCAFVLKDLWCQIRFSLQPYRTTTRPFEIQSSFSLQKSKKNPLCTFDSASLLPNEQSP